MRIFLPLLLLGTMIGSNYALAATLDLSPGLGTWSSGDTAFPITGGVADASNNNFIAPVFHLAGGQVALSFIAPAVQIGGGSKITLTSSTIGTVTPIGVMQLASTPTCDQDVGHFSGFHTGYVSTSGSVVPQIGFDGTSMNDCSGGVVTSNFDTFADGSVLPGDVSFPGPSGPSDTDYCVAVGVSDGSAGNFPAYGQLIHFNFHYTDDGNGNPVYGGCSVNVTHVTHFEHRTAAVVSQKAPGAHARKYMSR